MIMVKSTCDVLTGLNKLDHLIVVSVFQVQKDVLLSTLDQSDDLLENSLLRIIEKEIVKDSLVKTSPRKKDSQIQGTS